MAFVEDLIGHAARVSVGESGGDPIVVDCSVRETHSIDGQVSDHPVETGIDIVDHYRVLPRKVQLEAIISDTPLTTGFPGATLVNSVIGLVEGDKSPSLNAWEEFQRFFDEAVVVDVNTSLKKYTNMVLTSFAVTRDAATGQVLAFTLAAREIRFVSTAFGEAIELPSKSLGGLGDKEKSAGKRTNDGANGAQKKKASTLFQTFIK